jgi:GntR family transcriptional regulator
MEISVSKESGTPLREQIFAQIALLIGAGRLKPGDVLPSVRALAKRLDVHYNTVSQAYHDLASAGLLAGPRGGRLIVRFPDEPSKIKRHAKDLDDLINDAIKVARQQGYTLQQLRQRVRERLLEAPPDHLLVVSEEAAMQTLLRTELIEAVSFPVETCFTADLSANPGLAVGALILAPPGTMPAALSFLHKSQPVIPILYSEASEQLDVVRALPRPGLIAVASISRYFLDISRGVLSPVVGQRHSMTEYLLTANGTCPIGSADIVFCDCVARRRLRIREKRTPLIPYRLLSKQCLAQVRSLMADLADTAL